MVSTNDDDNDDSKTCTNEEDAGGEAVAAAAPHEAEAHRNALGEMIQHLADQGIDVEKLASDAGIPTSDVDQLSHGELADLTGYIAQNHPEVLQSVSERFPAAQGLIGMLSGGNQITNMLGGFFGGQKKQDS